MKTINKKLQNILLVNAGFSITSAMNIFLFPLKTAAIMGLSDVFWLQFVAIGLLFFAALVGFVAFQKTTDPLWVKLIIVQDVLWVITSVLVLTIRPWGLSMAGLLLIASIAVIISLFSWFQIKYLPNTTEENNPLPKKSKY
jgi:hypothetical protein